MPEIPDVGSLSAQTLGLQGFGLYIWIQATKGKAYPEKWVPGLATVLAALFAVIDFWLPEQVQWTANATLILFGGATGLWAINKATKPPSSPS